MPVPLSPAFLVSSAMALVDPPGALCTPSVLVERYRECVGAPERDAGDADWSLAFVQYAGFSSHYDPRSETSAWPLPAGASFLALKHFAQARGVLVCGAPRFGDVYLLWSRSKRRYERAGIIVSADNRVLPHGEVVYDCRAIDADTDHAGWMHGPNTLVAHRRIAPERHDCLVRWVDLELGATLSNVLREAA